MVIHFIITHNLSVLSHPTYLLTVWMVEMVDSENLILESLHLFNISGSLLLSSKSPRDITSSHNIREGPYTYLSTWIITYQSCQGRGSGSLNTTLWMHEIEIDCPDDDSLTIHSLFVLPLRYHSFPIKCPLAKIENNGFSHIFLHFSQWNMSFLRFIGFDCFEGCDIHFLGYLFEMESSGLFYMFLEAIGWN